MNSSNKDTNQDSTDLSSLMNQDDTSYSGPIIQEAPLPSTSSSSITANPHIPSVSASAVLGESATMPKDTPICKGYDFSNPYTSTNGAESREEETLSGILKAMKTTGFQATNLALAIEQIQEMRQWRLSDVPIQPNEDPELADPSIREKIRARIFFSYTSNQISSGQREVIRYMVQHNMVDVIVTTAGGIEEDLMKCFAPTYMGDFKLNGRELRKKGINRIGNLLVPNRNYCQFEDWVTPLLEKMHEEQEEMDRVWAKEVANLAPGEDIPKREGTWTPSKVIERLGHEIKDESSVLYWAAKNGIPVFCPALTDGSVGDMLYFHSYKKPGFILDTNEDIRRINDLAVQSHCTGQIIIGGGLVKHHTCNANLMRNGANYSVYINTGQEYDGSDSGASPEEALSWGKIRIDAKPVKVCAEATIVWPLIVSETFAKNVDEWKAQSDGCVCWYGDLKC